MLSATVDTPAEPGLLAIVAYEGFEPFEYGMAVEIFGRDRSELGVPWYRSVIVATGAARPRGSGGVRVSPTAPLQALAQARTIVLPGWRLDGPPPSAALRSALQAAAERRARLLSICTGAFLLAECGLLDGQRATTHWMHAAEFRRRYPRVQFVDDVLYVDAGHLITSAGSAAGLDACLHLLRRDFGSRLANTVARRMVCAPHREGGQAQYVESPLPERRAQGVAPLLDWLRSRLHEPTTVAQMAARMSTSERSFLRRFQAAVGQPPARWLQQARIMRARELLETTSLALPQVAEQCGFESAETFRAAFRRHIGVAPAAYRTRFSTLPAA